MMQQEKKGFKYRILKDLRAFRISCQSLIVDENVS